MYAVRAAPHTLMTLSSALDAEERALALLPAGVPCSGTHPASLVLVPGWWATAFFAPGRRLLTLTNGRSDTGMEPTKYRLCLSCLMCPTGEEGRFRFGAVRRGMEASVGGGSMGFHWGKNESSIRRAAVGHSSRTAASCSAFFWGGWMGATTGGLLVSWVCLSEQLCGCSTRLRQREHEVHNLWAIRFEADDSSPYRARGGKPRVPVDQPCFSGLWKAGELPCCKGTRRHTHIAQNCFLLQMYYRDVANGILDALVFFPSPPEHSSIPCTNEARSGNKPSSPCLPWNSNGRIIPVTCVTLCSAGMVCPWWLWLVCGWKGCNG